MKQEIFYKNKRREIEVKRCGLFGRVRGLMFCRRENAPALLLFDFKKPRSFTIHSFFCPVFLAVWLDEKNKVIEKRIVQLWQASIAPKRKFSKLVEIPINVQNRWILKFLDGD